MSGSSAWERFRRSAGIPESGGASHVTGGAFVVRSDGLRHAWSSDYTMNRNAWNIHPLSAAASDLYLFFVSAVLYSSHPRRVQQPDFAFRK
jgi:hypothetical protein